MVHQVDAERLAKRFEWPMLGAALLSIPAIVIESSSHTGPAARDIAVTLDWVVWAAFAVEAVAMLIAVHDRWRWLRTHPLEVAIVVLTPPFLPGPLQIIRVMRLFRLLIVLRAVGLSRRLFSLEGVRDAAVAAIAVVLAGGAAFSSVEKAQHLSAWDGVWWAITTVTTVGYGDYAPKTAAGRVIAIVVMSVGIGFVALLTAAAAQRFSRVTAAEAEILARLDRLEQLLEQQREKVS